MSMSITFDTLAYANKLKAAGVESRVAEAQAEAQHDLFAEVIENKLATKEDINQLKIATKEDINQLKIATKEDINQLKIATKEDINQLKQDIGQLKQDVGQLENRLTLKLGTLMASSIALLAALMTILHSH